MTCWTLWFIAGQSTSPSLPILLPDLRHNRPAMRQIANPRSRGAAEHEVAQFLEAGGHGLGIKCHYLCHYLKMVILYRGRIPSKAVDHNARRTSSLW